MSDPSVNRGAVVIAGGLFVVGMALSFMGQESAATVAWCVGCLSCVAPAIIVAVDYLRTRGR